MRGQQVLRAGVSMSNPVLVDVMRGDVVESRHRGAIVVCDGDGRVVLSLGDVERPVFPRSAVKAIQALPLVESGAADAFGFSDEDLAFACASHSGEPVHAAKAAELLARAGLDVAALECGAHWPSGEEAAHELARRHETPTALHNNCSGKHSGFLCTCVHAGFDPRGYVRREHAEQQLVREALVDVTGAAHDEESCGIDGCSIPTYAVPLVNLATGFARMVTGEGLLPARVAAARRLVAACMAHPWFVAGTGRADTLMMEAGKGRIFTKTGAEGVFCAAIPDLGLGIALKCDDGAGRAAEVMVASVLAALVSDDAALAARLNELAHPVLKNRNGMGVGSLQPTEALTGLVAVGG
jgi:L-asparaginase II